ncbi:phenylacetate--CoA ligase family protein [Flavobacterium sp. LaA7.5]|nr:phenylacetate--CoA ligase family protein [Flavobacterium salilacus subsp. altitudinum]
MKQLFLEKIRNKSFKLVDSIKGKGVSKHYNEISRFFSAPDNTKRESIVQEKITALLQHAATTVPHYHSFSGKSLSEFPVTDKTLIRNDYNLFLSSMFDDSQRISLVTSGSTGTPFKIYQDYNKKNRNSADTIYFAEKAGFTVGSKLVYLKIWSDYNKKKSLTKWMQNIQTLDVIDLDDKKIEGFIKQLENDKSTFGLLGYSSALELVARYLEKNRKEPVKAKVGSIISMSEALNEYTKTTLPNYFNVPVLSRYSNIENGIIAQQEDKSGTEFFINSASYYIEILDINSEKPVKDGELGRIVVTDFYNYAMPMIRYDTGDIGAFNPNDRNYLARIEGRKLDLIYDTKGALVSSYIVYKNMWQYTDINQYQLIQCGEKDYIFKINCDKTFDKEEQLIREFKTYLGGDANFQIEYVDEIPLLSSGKRKKIVNTFHTK